MTLVGPLFRYELTRLARRGLQPRLRAVFAGLLLGALLLTYLNAVPGQSPLGVLVRVDQPLSIDEASRFGERFLISFLVVQFVVVVVATPAVVGGAIAEEKERGSLDFLLSSPLSAREIVLGKMAARLVFVGAVVLTGLPVLTLTMFFGGVDAGLLLAGYAITLLTVLSHGAYALYLSVKTGELRPTLIQTYAVVVVLGVFGFCCGCLVVPGLLSPFSTLFYHLTGSRLVVPGFWPDQVRVVAGYAAVHVALTVWFLWQAVEMVREPATYRPTPLAHRPVGYVYPDDGGWLPRHPGLTRRWRFVPPLQPDEDPLLWKEKWFGPRLGPPPESNARACLFAVLVLVAVFGLIVIFLWTYNRLTRGLSIGDIYGGLGQAMAVVLLPLLVLGVGLLAAGSVATERQRQTLDGLLALPGDRADVIRAKARTALRAGRLVAVVLAGFFAAGWFTGGFALVTLLTAPVTAAGWVVAALGFGMWLSVRSPTSVRSTGYFLGAILAVSFLPPLAAPLVRDSVTARGDPAADLVEAAVEGLSPIWGALNGLPGRDYWDADTGAAAAGVAGSLTGAVVVGLAGAACWWTALRRFENEGR
jgi:ABC-type transport system involved in multi-copper enzyme maturation permease subunit